MTMIHKMQPFTFETQPVRIEMLDGQPWFVLADVCKVLEIKNPRNVAARLDEDEKDGVRLMDGIGREQEFTVVNESGLYAVILRSDKPQAKTFRKWVTSEVLPALRQTGSYTIQPAPSIAPTHLPDPTLVGREALRGILQEFDAQAVRLDTIESRLNAAPIQGDKVGAIYDAARTLGRCMGDYGKAWRLFKEQFGLASYRDLPSSRFDEAMRFLRLQVASYGGNLPERLL